MFRLDSIEGLVKPYEVLVAQLSISTVAGLWTIAPQEPTSVAPLVGFLYVAHSVESRRRERESWIGNEDIRGASDNDG